MRSCYGLREVALSLVAIAAMSWCFRTGAREVQIERPTMGILQVRREAATLLQLGLAFMASGLLTMALHTWSA